MKKIFNSTLVLLLLLFCVSLPFYVSAHEGSTRVIDIAKDCEFMYVLK